MRQIFAHTKLELRKTGTHIAVFVSGVLFPSAVPDGACPVTGVSNLNQLKDALAACDIDFEPELFGGWVIDGGDR